MLPQVNFIDLIVFEICGHKLQISWPRFEATGHNWSLFAPLVGGRPHVTPSMNFIRPSSTELLQF